MARLATEKDFSFVKQAWTICFDDPQKFVDWNFAVNYDKNNTIIAELDGVPASNMQLMPYTISLRGKPLTVSYVSGVATLPEYRHRGLVRDLFRTGFDLMRSRGTAVSLLVPFHYAFYEKFGYKQCYDKPEYAGRPSLTAGKLDLSDLEYCIPVLDRIYRKGMQNQNGYVLRSHRDWHLILDDLHQNSDGSVYLHRTGSEIDGYAIFADNKTHECCGIPPFRCDISEVKPFAMARVTDVKTILSTLASTFSGDLALRINDEQIPENNGCYQIRNHGVNAADGYDFTLDIQTFTQLVFGYIDDCTHTGLFSKTKNYINLLL